MNSNEAIMKLSKTIEAAITSLNSSVDYLETFVKYVQAVETQNIQMQKTIKEKDEKIKELSPEILPPAA